MRSKTTVMGPSDLVIAEKEAHGNSVYLERVTLIKQKVVDAKSLFTDRGSFLELNLPPQQKT